MNLPTHNVSMNRAGIHKVCFFQRVCQIARGHCDRAQKKEIQDYHCVRPGFGGGESEKSRDADSNSTLRSSSLMNGTRNRPTSNFLVRLSSLSFALAWKRKVRYESWRNLAAHGRQRRFKRFMRRMTPPAMCPSTITEGIHRFLPTFRNNGFEIKM